MSQTDRQKRLRLLVKKLNRQRKQQARKIDILCHNLIAAQRTFIDRLQGISFAAQFYHSLLGCSDLNAVLERAGRLLRQELPEAGVRFFLRQPDGCELHATAADEAFLPQEPRPEDFFHAELTDSVCKANRPCTSEDLFGLGLNRNLKGVGRFSIATLPLSDLGRSLGFVLLYRRTPQTLTPGELQRVSPVLCGLSQAIRTARLSLPTGP
jgi:hypothetical protein